MGNPLIFLAIRKKQKDCRKLSPICKETNHLKRESISLMCQQEAKETPINSNLSFIRHKPEYNHLSKNSNKDRKPMPGKLQPINSKQQRSRPFQTDFLITTPIIDHCKGTSFKKIFNKIIIRSQEHVSRPRSSFPHQKRLSSFLLHQLSSRRKHPTEPDSSGNIKTRPEGNPTPNHSLMMSMVRLKSKQTTQT